MTAIEPAGETEIVETQGCRATLWFPAPGMIGAKIVGHASGAAVARIYEIIDARAGGGPPPEDGFLDLTELDGFDWEARGRALRWNIAHRGAKQRLHLLVQSARIEIGVRIFRLVLRDMVEIHTKPETFSLAYSAVVKRRLRITGGGPPSSRPRY